MQKNTLLQDLISQQRWCMIKQCYLDLLLNQLIEIG